jgi:nicotinate-nucleotide adenylyltransferase
VRIGISGGTFDPIHMGHLIIAEGVRALLSLDKVLFIPVGIPPHKDSKSMTPAFHRLKMVEKAIEENPHFEVLDMEVKRNDVTYTVDTLRELCGEEGGFKTNRIIKNAGSVTSREKDKFFYIIGADILFHLLSWKNYEEVFGMCAFVVVYRPGYSKEKVLERVLWLKENFNIEIEIVDLPMVDVSSTYIRESFKKDKMIKYFIPNRVEEYILENKLYR